MDDLDVLDVGVCEGGRVGVCVAVRVCVLVNDLVLLGVGIVVIEFVDDSDIDGVPVDDSDIDGVPVCDSV